MTDAKMEHRTQARHDFLSSIEYILEPPANDEKLHKGVIINVTSEGLGVYILDHLASGQKIIIQKGLPADYQLAAVCWIRQEKTHFCRAGLKLIKAPAD
jgi:hypothetical protein